MSANDPERLASDLVQSGLRHADHGSLIDAAADLERALAFGDRCPDRTRVMLEASRVQMALGELTEAEDLAGSALATATEADDEHVVMLALGTLGQLRKRRGDHRGALGIARDGRDRAVRLGDAAEHFTFTLDESFALEALGEMDAAIAVATEAQRIARHNGDPTVELKATGRLGALLRDVGRLDEAHRTAVQGIEQARRLGDRFEEAGFQIDLGLALLLQHQPDEATAAFGEAFLLLLEVGSWEFSSRLVATLSVTCTEPAEADVLWLAARAGSVIILNCGDELRPVVERHALRAMLAAIRLGSRSRTEVHVSEIYGRLTEADQDRDRPSRAPLLGAAIELVIHWWHGAEMEHQAELVQVIDEEIGGPWLAGLLATPP